MSFCLGMSIRFSVSVSVYFSLSLHFLHNFSPAVHFSRRKVPFIKLFGTFHSVMSLSLPDEKKKIDGFGERGSNFGQLLCACEFVFVHVYLLLFGCVCICYFVYAGLFVCVLFKWDIFFSVILVFFLVPGTLPVSRGRGSIS